MYYLAILVPIFFTDIPIVFRVCGFTFFFLPVAFSCVCGPTVHPSSVIASTELLLKPRVSEYPH